MFSAVAGPYSDATAEERQRNLDAMNEAAARLMEMGHVPVIGMNAALPVPEKAVVSDRYAAIMAVSLAEVAACDALLLIGESPGANKERAPIRSQGKPISSRIEDAPLS